LESNQNQYLKGTVEWSQTENQNKKESNRNQELKRVAMYQIENQNRMESNRIQVMKGCPTDTNS
jgi:hypothetical protein